MRPIAAWASATSRSQSAGTPTSATITCAIAPSARSSAAVDSARSGTTSTHATSAPSRANTEAMA